MRFCTSCGKEQTPGKKFCEYCGTPVEESAAVITTTGTPTAPVSPTPVLVTPSGGSGKTMVIAGMIGILFIAAGVYFVGMPLMTGSKGTGSDLQQSTILPSPSLTQVQITISTKTTTAIPTVTSPAVSQTYEDKYTETYNQVYAADHAFIGGQKDVFAHDTSSPPLYIKFNITPKMFYGEKTVDIDLSSERVINTSYTSPSAWFKVSVYDAGNGGLVEEQGFNKGFGITTKQEFMVRAPGNYRVEMTGNDVIAEVRILTGK